MGCHGCIFLWPVIMRERAPTPSVPNKKLWTWTNYSSFTFPLLPVNPAFFGMLSEKQASRRHVSEWIDHSSKVSPKEKKGQILLLMPYAWLFPNRSDWSSRRKTNKKQTTTTKPKGDLNTKPLRKVKIINAVSRVNHGLCRFMAKGKGIRLSQVSPQLLGHRVLPLQNDMSFTSSGAKTLVTGTANVKINTFLSIPSLDACSLTPSSTMLTKISDELSRGNMITVFGDRRSKPDHGSCRILKITRNLILNAKINVTRMVRLPINSLCLSTAERPGKP